MAAQVYFIGAGPGDPGLLTIKGRGIIEQADVIIYADSLINPEICSLARREAEVHKSASLTLDEITGLILNAVKQGKMVARLQSGDPIIYGALQEQIENGRFDPATLPFLMVLASMTVLFTSGIQLFTYML